MHSPASAGIAQLAPNSLEDEVNPAILNGLSTDEYKQADMHHQTTLVYSESLLRQAVFAFWRRTVGVGFLLALLLLACGFAFLVRQGDRSCFVGALGAIILGGFGIAAAIYFVHIHNALAKFRAMGAPDGTLVLDDSSFTVSTGLGSSTLQWSAVKEVWQFPSFWLLLFSKAQFMTLPLDSIPDDAQEFILSKVSAAGGKVAG